MNLFSEMDMGADGESVCVFGVVTERTRLATALSGESAELFVTVLVSTGCEKGEQMKKRKDRKETG